MEKTEEEEEAWDGDINARSIALQQEMERRRGGGKNPARKTPTGVEKGGGGGGGDGYGRRGGRDGRVGPPAGATERGPGGI